MNDAHNCRYLDQRDKLLGEVATLRARIRNAEARHKRTVDNRCSTCAYVPYPCPTLNALGDTL